jgi:hypothetical protein
MVTHEDENEAKPIYLSVLSIDYETSDPGRFYLAVDINPERKTDPGNLKHP